MLKQYGHKYLKDSARPRPPHVNPHALLAAFEEGDFPSARALRALAAGRPPGSLVALLFRWVAAVNGVLLAVWRLVGAGVAAEAAGVVDVEAARAAEAKATRGRPPLMSMGGHRVVVLPGRWVGAGRAPPTPPQGRLSSPEGRGMKKVQLDWPVPNPPFARSCCGRTRQTCSGTPQWRC
jgi:hypothetical protein